MNVQDFLIVFGGIDSNSNFVVSIERLDANG